ncbi:MAG: helix-turn-helix domain-containing protein [Spirochaetes bacterium]|uniref:Helix-turn-helix domain-containing protein n=1 Tax=Candidatus Ornithospirochaeta stercoripullorum TaxID=2840899 RepID=A0A9D9DYR1_9SPIO|nr:helix-turn-helix domain-containing protein [Candidatus Ornithospirochaeta stercoripullorum]
MKDEIRKYGSSVGDDINEVFDKLFTKDEKAEIDVEVQLMEEMIKARKEKGLTQKELGKLCGLPQSSIARIENGTFSPSISTVTRVLSALGKRLYVGNMT